LGARLKFFTDRVVTQSVTQRCDVDAAVRKIAETMAGQYASTAQDLARASAARSII
jgi:hypothetical protein